MHPDEFTNEEAWMAAGTMRRDQPATFDPATAPPSGEPGSARFLIDWVDQHRESDHPADPAYPSGSAIDVAIDAMKACRLELPYPAARCGIWVVTCRECGFSVALATAGRADDPKSVRMPCRLH
jgi:hypothetical protein